jgi:hypothetical protein
MYFTDRTMDKNNLSKKSSSVIYGLFVSPSVINLPMDLQTNKARQQENRM